MSDTDVFLLDFCIIPRRCFALLLLALVHLRLAGCLALYSIGRILSNERGVYGLQMHARFDTGFVMHILHTLFG